jgi:hypothetical protein
MISSSSALSLQLGARALRLVLVASLLATTIACGIRTPPRPPEDTMPRVARDLGAKRDGTSVRLEWERPDKSMDGQRLADLNGFLVERRGSDGSFTIIADVPADTTHRLRPFKHYSYVDEAAPDGNVEYRIVGYTADGQRSPPSTSAFTANAEPKP